MPLPKPRKSESQSDFIKRSMSSEIMKSEYPDTKQRLAVSFSQYRRRNKTKHIKEFFEFINEKSYIKNE